MRAKLTFGLIIFALASPLFAQFNQWQPENGVPIRFSPAIDYSRCIESNSDGQVLIAWSEYSGDSHKIRVMLTDETGQFLWNNPLFACTVEENQLLPAILPLADGQWLIAWMDYRESSIHAKVYVQKIDNFGNFYFDLNGVLISDEIDSPIYSPEIVSDGNGGAIISWIDVNDTDNDLFAQHIDSNGSILWEQSGRLVAGGGLNQGGESDVDYHILPDNNNGAFLAWIEYYPNRSGYGVTVQRIDGDGNPLWTETNEEGLIISNLAQNIYKVEIAADGSGGIFATWDDNDRSNWQGNIFAQHLDSDGNLLWSANGENVSQMETGVCYRPRICSTDENEAIIIFEYEQQINEPNSTYMQKISGQDEINLLWNEGQSVLLSQAELPVEGIFHTRLAVDGVGGAFAVWNAFIHDNIHRSIVQIQKISSDGELEWGQEQELTGENIGYLPSIRATNDNEVIVCWEGRLNVGTSIQIQAINNEAELSYNDGGVSVAQGIDGSVHTMTTTESSENIYAGWLDYRSQQGISYSRPYLQKIDHQGNILFAENGINISPDLNDLFENYTADCDELKLCTDNNGGVYAGFDIYNDAYTKEIILQHVNSDGSLPWGNIGYVIEAEPYYDKSIVDLIPLNNSDFLLVYAELDENWYQQLIIERLSSEHVATWTEAIDLPTTSDEGDAYFLDYIKLNDDEFAIAYCNVIYNTQNFDYVLCVDKFNSDGSLLWENPIEIDAENIPYTNMNYCLNILNNDILLTWIDRNLQNNDSILRSSLISPDGDFAWDEEIIDLHNLGFSPNIVKVDIADDNSTSFWMSYVNYSETQQYELFIQRYNDAGESIFTPTEGIQIESEYQVYDMEILVLEDNSVYVVWETYDESDDDNIVFMHYDQDGNIVNAAVPYPDSGAILTDARRRQFDPQIIQSGDTGFITLWQDYRTSTMEYRTNIYMQKSDDGITGISGQNYSLQPGVFEISKTWPNPFNPSINISYQLAKKSAVKISVFDILGREVKVLLNSEMNTGQHQVTWDGNSSSGLPVASGTYFLKMKTAENICTRKITLVK